jgi:hypothetical protein
VPIGSHPGISAFTVLHICSINLSANHALTISPSCCTVSPHGAPHPRLTAPEVPASEVGVHARSAPPRLPRAPSAHAQERVPYNSDEPPAGRSELDRPLLRYEVAMRRICPDRQSERGSDEPYPPQSRIPPVARARLQLTGSRYRSPAPPSPTDAIWGASLIYSPRVSCSACLP